MRILLDTSLFMESKSIFRWVIVVLAAAIIGIAYFKLSEPRGEQGNPFRNIPINSQIICNIDGLGNSGNETEFLGVLLSGANDNTCFRAWERLLITLDSLRKVERDWYDLLQQAPIALAAQDAYNASGWALYIGLDAGSKPDKLMDAWLHKLPARDFKGTAMHIGTELSWSAQDQCIVISPSPAALEQMVISCNSGDVVASNESFRQAFELRSKDVPLHIFAKASESSWLQLDPIFKNNGTQLTGYFINNEKKQHPLQLAATGAETPSIDQVLPSSTIFLDLLNTSDPDTLWQTQSAYYAGTDAEKYWTEIWQATGDSCQCDVNEIFVNWRNGECGVAVIEGSDSTTATVTFAGVLDSIDVIAAMQPIILEATPQTQGIHTLKFQRLFERNAMPTVPLEHNYIMQWEGYVFTASTPSQLQLIQKIGDKLASQNAYRLSRQLCNQEASRSIYLSGGSADVLPSALSVLLASQKNYIVDVEQMPSGKFLLSIGLDIKTSGAPKAVEAPQHPELDTDVPAQVSTDNAKSWTVINHNTQEKEQLECDTKGRLTLKDAGGKVLWTRNLGAPVLGDVVQVDALKNNKLQYVFTTETGLYLIDRNGKDVTGFPYQPKPTITSPLLVADYDNTKKYRLIFAMGDDMILNMSVDGKMTSGWKYQSKNTGDAVKAIKSAKIGDDDVLFAVSANGSIQLLKRTGEEKAICKTILTDYNGGAISIVPSTELGGSSVVYNTDNGERTTQISIE